MAGAVTVRYFDYRPEYRQLESEITAACRRVLESGRLILGEEVLGFEQERAEFLGLPHAIGVNSGTDAIALALRALGVGAGDEVITVAATPPMRIGVTALWKITMPRTMVRACMAMPLIARDVADVAARK